MKDFHSIIRAVQSDTSLAESAALVTLVKVSGSFYRRPGARMLITGKGDTVGTVSGGCLENDLIEKAKRVIKSGQPSLVQYSTEHPETKIGKALKGCGGDVEILIEPFRKELFNLLVACLTENARDNCTSAMATVIRAAGNISVKVGDRLVTHDGKIELSEITYPSLADAIYNDVEEVIRNGNSINRLYTIDNDEIEVFIERFQTPTSVLLIGAGDVALSIAAIAHELGWSTTVVDHRPHLAIRNHFPHSDCITLSEPSDLLKEVAIERIKAAVILTHICEADMEYLKQLLPSSIKYIGLLGSRNRVAGLLDFLKNLGVAPEQEIEERIYGPVGLDLGAEAPPEIALSIISEIQAVLSGRTTQSLKNKAKRTRQEV